MTSHCSDRCCPLCHGSDVVHFHEDKWRSYLRCSHCLLVFVPSQHWLTAMDEKAVYDLHNNDVNDPGYRKFLSRLSVPLIERLGAHQQGLDFGCGPGPTLSVMLQEQGHQVELYDPFYYNNPSVLNKQYDFVCSTEVLEHMHEPKQGIATLFSMLRPGSWLGLMTKLVLDEQAFSRWHYILDQTHVSFYCQRTFEYIADLYDAELYFIANDVILLRRKA